MRKLPPQSDVTLTHDGVIMFLWTLGLDTLDIAKRIGLHESQVANRLWKLRSRMNAHCPITLAKVFG